MNVGVNPAVDAWSDGLLNAVVRRIDPCLLDEAVAMGWSRLAWSRT